MRPIALVWIGWLALAVGIASAAAPVSEETVHDVAAQLRCVVCQSLSVADSPSETAHQMRGVIRERLAAGETPDQVKAYFVEKYGEWILLAPKDPLLWVIPVAGVLTALGALTWWLSSRRVPASPPVQPQPTAPTDDPYRRRILRELGE